MNSWRSDNLPIPIGEFLRMFRLTDKELFREGASGRLVVNGTPTSPTVWERLHVSEGAAQAWIQSTDLPPRIQRKVRQAGGFDCLEAWRKRYFERVQVDFENNEIILPDGSRISDARISPKSPLN